MVLYGSGTGSKEYPRHGIRLALNEKKPPVPGAPPSCGRHCHALRSVQRSLARIEVLKAGTCPMRD